jgi:hypothetical protein
MARANSRADRTSGPGEFDPRIHTALTDLHAYVLLLDAEWRQLGERIEELARADSRSTESFELAARRAAMAEELEALREAVTTLREQADAAGGKPPCSMPA